MSLNSWRRARLASPTSQGTNEKSKMNQMSRAIHLRGQIQVVLQFGLLIALYAATMPHWAVLARNLEVIVFFLACIAVGFAAVKAHPPGNFNIHPKPKAHGQLVQAGIYRYIRHPMYSAVMLFGVACVLAAPSTLSAALMIALCATLFWKAVTEEAMLRNQYPGYADYCRRTKRFVPWLV